MKFREIWPFISTRFKLSSIPVKKLHASSDTDIPVIVSLTTIPSRIKSVHLTVRSILSQNQKPKKVVLWLHENLKSKVPSSLQKIEGPLFKIHFTKNDFSHLKLIETINLYPDEYIITVDDDLMYPPEFLTLLYNTHKKYPNTIVANEVRQITYTKDGTPKPYVEWYHTKEQPKDSTFLLPLGVFGVLYPPNSLHEDATNSELIKKLAPKADDLWFRAMGILQKTEVIISETQPSPAVLILGTQAIALKRTNKHQDYNRTQWEQLMEYYGISATTKI
ncbi:glycosyltransferase [Patiriisocius hiemis]|uniref:Glycosyl transferase n=1 Tax=Patiriisocius hiemis TaxID=3075604 RepID=A0ABU2Y9Z7_9FLAO|nr:glycosyltransferase [Constantimarinum sp. W242]MDT0555020.1 glycosyl transferase [Constantimarinum sp. W242]